MFVLAALNQEGFGLFIYVFIFCDWTARQVGFSDGSECVELCKLAIEYLKNPKACEEKICELFADEEDVKSLYVMLVEEFETCILSYFAFHWSQAAIMITQVIIFLKFISRSAV